MVGQINILRKFSVIRRDVYYVEFEARDKKHAEMILSDLACEGDFIESEFGDIQKVK